MKKRKPKKPVARNPFVLDSLKRKGGPVTDKRRRRAKDKLRRQTEEYTE